MSIADWLSPSSWVASAVNAVGGKLADSILGWHKDKLAAENNSERIKADLAQRELAVQQTEAQAQAQLKIAEIGHWYEPEKLFAYVLVVYFAKVYLWDAAFHLGSSDAVRGDAAEWAGMIMLFYFGKRGIENVVRIIKR